MVMKALNEAAKELIYMQDSDLQAVFLSTKFTEAVQAKMSKILPSAFEIEEDIVNKAKNLLGYFDMHKLVLAGYEIEPTKSFEEAYEDILKRQLDERVKLLNGTHKTDESFYNYNTSEITPTESPSDDEHFYQQSQRRDSPVQYSPTQF